MSEQDSLHQSPAVTTGKDPFEAIYALNIGDFVSENFISDDLLNKISDRLGNDSDKLKAQLYELVQIYSLDNTLGVLGFDPSEGFVIYDSMASTLCQMMQVDACHVFQIVKNEQGDSYLGLTGTSVPLADEERLNISIDLKSMNFLRDVLEQMDTKIVEDISKEPYWKAISALNQDKTKAVMTTPLSEGGKVLGLLVFEHYKTESFSPELIDLAEATANLWVTGSRLQQLVADAQHQLTADASSESNLLNLRAQITESIADLGIHQQQFLMSLSHAVDARHEYMKGHSLQVACISKLLGSQIKLNEKTLDLIYFAGLVGSIGKIHIPENVLTKQNKLTTEEWDELRNHPNVGVSLMGQINFLSEILPYVQSKNERWDGTGSPEGLKERNIPLGARILGLADAYFAMTSERPYRDKLLSHDEAIKVLQEEAGSKWDPMLVESMSSLSEDQIRDADSLY